MRKNKKLACGALTLNIISGITALAYLMHTFIGSRAAGAAAAAEMPFSFEILGILAGIMLLSTLIMVLALPRKNQSLF